MRTARRGREMGALTGLAAVVKPAVMLDLSAECSFNRGWAHQPLGERYGFQPGSAHRVA